MSATLVGAVATAGVLGVTHAIEPDHVAGIASLTGRYEDSRLSALVGACFSLGHVALVVSWLGVGYLLLRRTEFPPVFDTAGTLGVVVLLAVLGTALAVGGIKRVFYAHNHEHDHGDHAHSHTHTHLPLLSAGDHEHDGTASTDGASVPDHLSSDTVGHSHDHTVSAYLRTGVVGALFTLSPPLSMVAFSATLFSTGPPLVAVAVVAYAVTITATMTALGAGVGALFGRASELNVTVYGGTQALAGVLVVGLAGWLLVQSPLVG